MNEYTEDDEKTHSDAMTVWYGESPRAAENNT